MKKKDLELTRMTAFFAVLFTVFFLTGCEGKKEAAAAGGDPNALEKIPVLKISARDWNYIADDKGWFKPFTDNGTKIELVQGASGNEVQLFARGELHFHQRMLYPYMLFHTQGADLVAVQASTHPVTGVTAIVVKSESPYYTLEDLRGKKIGTHRISCPYMVLFELMEQKGWKEGVDWNYVNTREYRAAFIAGEIEAFSAHPTDAYASILTTGTGRAIAYPTEESLYINGGGVTVQFTTSEFAKKYPNNLKKLVEVMDSTYEWILANTDEAAGIIEKITRAPPNVSKYSWQSQIGNWKSEHDLAKVIRETDDMLDWLIAHGDIPAEKRPNAASLFAPEFFDPSKIKTAEAAGTGSALAQK